MSRPNILITGHTGYVASLLINSLSDWANLVGVSRTKLTDFSGPQYSLDLAEDNQDELSHLIDKERSTAILHLAGVKPSTQSQRNREQLNQLITKTVVKASRKSSENPLTLLLSSDYVFGNSEKPKSEVDTPSPVDWYGQSKLESEKILSKEPRSCVLRSGHIYTWPTHHGFFGYLHGHKTGARKGIPEIWKERFCPTYFKDLSRIINYVLEEERCGIFHASPNRVYQKKTLARLILGEERTFRSIERPGPFATKRWLTTEKTEPGRNVRNVVNSS